jgi:tetratricopeptide (TPR) repeat protein
MEPVRARESFDTGKSLMGVARYNQAIRSFDRAIALNPAFADAYLMRGKAYRADGNVEYAIQDFGKVIELRPADPGALLERCSAQLQQKNYGAAISDATKALHLEPKLGLAYSLLGSAVRGAGDLPGAIQDFDWAIALQPNPDNFLERGITYQLLGDHQSAIADFNEVIWFLPRGSAAYVARATSRLALGDIHGAEQDRRLARILDGT